jgi:O-antigen/teichoic acid export membrane protein
MSDIHKLIKNLSVYTFGNSLTKIIAVLLLPLYSAFLSPTDYGIISAMGLLISFGFVIITLSLDRSIYRCYFEYESEEDRKLFLGTITISLIVITSSFVILIFLFSRYVNLIFEKISFYPYYFIAVSTMYLSVFYTIGITFYRITEQSKKFVLMTVSFFLLQTGIIILFVVVLKRGAEGKLVASLIANLIYLPIVFFIIKRNAIFRFRYKMFRNAILYSLPVIPSLLSGLILALSDRAFIERYLTLSDVGIYSMGYTLASFLTILIGGFYGAYNPAFFRIANLEKEKKSLLSTINNQFIIITVILYFIVFLFAEDIVRIFLNSRYYESYKIFQLIIIGNIFSTAFGILNVSFAQDKKMVTMMFIVLSGAILNLGLNFLLIPIYGMYGAAYATIISFAVLGMVKYYFARNYYFIPWEWKNILFYLFVIISFYLTYIFLSSGNLIYDSGLKIMISGLIITIYLIRNKKSFTKLLEFTKYK